MAWCFDQNQERPSDYTSILECDNEEVADLVLNAVKRAVKRRAYIVPEFDPLGSYEVQKLGLVCGSVRSKDCLVTKNLKSSEL